MELARLAPYRARAARPAPDIDRRRVPAIRYARSACFAARRGRRVAAQTNAQADPSFPDLRTLVLSASEMPGYVSDPNRSALQDRQDGQRVLRCGVHP